MTAAAPGGEPAIPTDVRAFAGLMSLDGGRTSSRAVIDYDAPTSTHAAFDEAGVVAHAGCVQEGLFTARCAESPLAHFSFSGGKGDDRLMGDAGDDEINAAAKDRRDERRRCRQDRSGSGR